VHLAVEGLLSVRMIKTPNIAENYTPSSVTVRKFCSKSVDFQRKGMKVGGLAGLNRKTE